MRLQELGGKRIINGYDRRERGNYFDHHAQSRQFSLLLGRTPKNSESFYAMVWWGAWNLEDNGLE